MPLLLQCRLTGAAVHETEQSASLCSNGRCTVYNHTQLLHLSHCGYGASAFGSDHNSLSCQWTWSEHVQQNQRWPCRQRTLVAGLVSWWWPCLLPSHRRAQGESAMGHGTCDSEVTFPIRLLMSAFLLIWQCTFPIGLLSAFMLIRQCTYPLDCWCPLSCWFGSVLSPSEMSS